MSLDCTDIKKINEITDQITYIDKVSGGAGDSNQVSCGESKSNELLNKYNEHFSNINEALIASIMCKCCKKLKPTSKEKITWLEFYACMKSRLNAEKHPKTIKKLDALIAYHQKRT